MSTDDLIARGLMHLREHNNLAALACFERAYAEAKSPTVLSCLGLCIALERGQFSEALRLCHDAIGSEPDNPLHYLNLGKVLLKSGKKQEAISLFRQGLAAGENSEIRHLLESLGSRRRPLFPFMPRGHFLNKFAGLLLHRLRIRR